ncbi:MAG: hypothetical protein JO313_08685 [Verrucomicrobia bacterium]|nr:hypothetical protein [Verrucomicrobiota bacterium]
MRRVSNNVRKDWAYRKGIAGGASIVNAHAGDLGTGAVENIIGANTKFDNCTMTKWPIGGL